MPNTVIAAIAITMTQAVMRRFGVGMTGLSARNESGAKLADR